MIPKSLFDQTIKRYFAPIVPLMNDPSVSEIMANGPFDIWVERKGEIQKTNARFADAAALMAALRHLSQYLGRPINEERPILEGRLPDGSRVEAVLPPIVEGGAHVSIRRFSKNTLTLDRLVEMGAMDERSLDLIRRLVSHKKNILVSGGTGSGKTSLLGALTGVCSETERIVVIEDSREIQPQLPHCVRLEVRQPDSKGRGAVGIRDLFRATLRMRPDRIIVGEIRGGEAIDLIQAMTSGHGGSMSTLHASSPREALGRLETMALMGDVELPLLALRSQIGLGVDIVIQTARFRCGARGLAYITRVKSDESSSTYCLEHLVKRVFTKESDGSLSQSELKHSDSLEN